jgi:hypothetical protein
LQSGRPDRSFRGKQVPYSGFAAGGEPFNTVTTLDFSSMRFNFKDVIFAIRITTDVQFSKECVRKAGTGDLQKTAV